MKKPISQLIEETWNTNQSFDVDSEEYKYIKKAVKVFFNKLDQGDIRLCTQVSQGQWQLNEWVKKGILIAFKIFQNEIFNSGFAVYYDKIHPKFDAASWDEDNFASLNIRVVPGSYVRKGVYLGKNVIIMPAFLNVGAYIGASSMIDSGATIGSGVQIGQNCHISSNVVLGGVLEPISNYPVIIEDNCFIGACSSISEGVIVEQGAVIASGVHLTSSTKIINRETGQAIYGRVPANSVVVSGSVAHEANPLLQTSCAIIVKTASEETRKKTSINDLLRL